MTITVNGPDGSTFNFPDGTPEDTISGALHQHYGTAPAAAAAPVDKPERAEGAGEDFAKSIGTGLAKTGIPNLVGMYGGMRQGMQGLGDWVGSQLFGSTPEQMAKARRAIESPLSPVMSAALPTPERVRGLLESSGVPEALGLGRAPVLSDIIKNDATGSPTGFQYHKGQHWFSPYAENAAAFAPGALMGGPRTIGQGVADVFRYGIVPGVTSEAAGQGAQAAGLPEWAQEIARLGGSLGSSALATKRISPNLSTSPKDTAQTYAEHVKTLEGKGFTLNPAEKAQDPALLKDISEAYPKYYQKNLEQVTRHATKEVGPEFETATIKTGKNGTLDNMFSTIGKRLDDVILPNNMTDAVGLGQNLTRIRKDLTSGVHDEAIAAFNGERARLHDAFAENGAPMLTGPQFQNMRSRIRASAMDAKGEATSKVLHKFADALDASFENSIPVAQAGEFAAANRAYRAAQVIKKATAEGGSASNLLHVTPAALESSVRKVYGPTEHARGRDPFDWAPSAKIVLQTAPDSGTAGRLMAHLKPTAKGLAAGSAGALGYMFGLKHGMADPVGALLSAEHIGTALGGATAGLLTPAARRLKYTTNLGSRMYGNQMMANRPGLLSIPTLLNNAPAATGAVRGLLQ